MNIKNTLSDLEKFCVENNFKGWDPYDGLNSKIFNSLPLKKLYLSRLIWIQLFKLSPMNFREIFLVPKQHNPKAIALFLTSYCNLYNINNDSKYIEMINYLADLLIKLKSKNYSSSCWGYNFDWQSRAFFLPKFTPTVVATSFAADSLFRAYKITNNNEHLKNALSSAEFILNDLNRTEKDNNFIFSYSPLDKTRVYNASLLGSRLLAQAYNFSNNNLYKSEAYNSVKAVVDKQSLDGSWIYGELEIQNWIDSFHTGYNLECIYEYQIYTGDNSFNYNIEIGLEYYLKNFFLEDGTPKYYNNKTYPIDVHCPAQFISTLVRLNKFKKNKKLADKVLNWTIKNMKHKDGYFYYQRNKNFASKIPYMRWAQAWMFYSLSFYLRAEKNGL